MVDFECKPRYDIQDLLRIMELLRSPDGCPWDRAQTHQSIRRNMLEEAYEAAEAIDENDPAHLKEELGDVLLQVVFHARMAQEAGWFDFDDVVNGVAQKLVFRHPYVFGDGQAADADGALNAWERQKRQEKDQRTTADALNAVARSLPALIRAEKVQIKAAKKELDKLGLKYTDYTVSSSNEIQSVVESAVGKVDALYSPTDNTIAAGASQVGQICKENKLPFVTGEEGMCKAGGLFTLSINYEDLGYAAGEMAVKILKGEAKPEDMPIKHLSSKDLVVVKNDEMAEALGIDLSALDE